MAKSNSNSDQKTQEPATRARVSHAPKALKEAQERKHLIDQANKTSANEKNGRGGLDPARFGDWEIKGITSDF